MNFLYLLLLLSLLPASRSDGSDRAEGNSIEHSTRSSQPSFQDGRRYNGTTAPVIPTNTTWKPDGSIEKDTNNVTDINTTKQMNNDSLENSSLSLSSSESMANTSVVHMKPEIGSLPNLSISTPESPRSLIFYQREGKICDASTDCNITNMERCEPARGGIQRCGCITGHSRAGDGTTCIAVNVYLVQLEATQPTDIDLDDHSTPEFRDLLYNAREAAIESIQFSKLGPIFIDASVMQLSVTPSGNVLLHYEVKLQRSYVPDVVVVRIDMEQGFIGQLSSSPNGSIFFGSTSIQGNAGDVADSLVVKDTNPCSKPELNYCDENAICLTSVRSFICRCKRGFQDESVDPVEAPGEKCRPTCGCQNGGECYIDENERPNCRCPQWYLGEGCTIDGRLLLIALAGVLGGILLLAMVCCICCIRYWKRRYRSKDEMSSIYSLPREHIHAHKLPSGGRSWYDTWRYYSFSPPNYTSGVPGSPQAKGPMPGVTHRSHYPPVMAYRRSAEIRRSHNTSLNPYKTPASNNHSLLQASQPIELVPQGYSGPYVPIPRPHVLPSSRHGTTSRHRGDHQWFWSTTGSSYA